MQPQLSKPNNQNQVNSLQWKNNDEGFAWLQQIINTELPTRQLNFTKHTVKCLYRFQDWGLAWTGWEVVVKHQCVDGDIIHWSSHKNQNIGSRMVMVVVTFWAVTGFNDYLKILFVCRCSTCFNLEVVEEIPVRKWKPKAYRTFKMQRFTLLECMKGVRLSSRAGLCM